MPDDLPRRTWLDAVNGCALRRLYRLRGKLIELEFSAGLGWVRGPRKAFDRLVLDPLEMFESRHWIAQIEQERKRWQELSDGIDEILRDRTRVDEVPDA